MTDTLTRAPLLMSGARGDYALQVSTWDSTTSISCEAAGLLVVLDASTTHHLGRCLLDAADLITDDRPPAVHLQRIGQALVHVLERGDHTFEVDAVRDDKQQVAGVLLTCDALAVDGVLDAVGARQLGQLLLAT